LRKDEQRGDQQQDDDGERCGFLVHVYLFSGAEARVFMSVYGTSKLVPWHLSRFWTLCRSGCWLRAKQFTRCCGGADQTTDSSEVLEDSPRRKRSFLFLTRGKGLRSRWQSRQSDRAERRRRSSEFKGALHSSQRGGPTRPLWSCAIEIPPDRTQTGEQMRQQMLVGLSRPAFRLLYWNDFVWTHFGNLIILRWRRTTGSQCSAPDGRAFPPKQWMGATSECPEWGSRRRRQRCAGFGKVAGRLIKPAPLPAMQSQLPLCIDILYDILRPRVNRKNDILRNFKGNFSYYRTLSSLDM